MNTLPFAIVTLAFGLSICGSVATQAADPNFVQDVDLPPRPDNSDYQLLVAANEYVYIVWVHHLGGKLISENL